MEKKSAGLVGASVKIESQATFLFARGRDQRAEFGFQKHVLPFFGSKRDDQGDCIFRKLRYLGAARAPARRPLWSFAGFLFGHVGGDCTPNRFNGKEKWKDGVLPSGTVARGIASVPT
jgi:hypothetical protein